jgi:hypothetical protein
LDQIPRAVLSEHFQEHMAGRRLCSAVFLTYQFDPGFFEQEVLSVILDIPLSHATALRLVQLEDAIGKLPGQVAVYYDANGLVVGSSGSAKLDVRRVPVQHHTGIFHPKNVFLLVEDEEPDEDGCRARTLIVASMSANLTRSGWWENVECCHVEEIAEWDKTRLKDDILALINELRRKVVADGGRLALQEIRAFLKSVEPRLQKSTSGRLHPHFYLGRDSLSDFLESTAGDALRGTYLEVISPYFDDAPECRPLVELIDRFQPKKVRVYLPRSASGEVLCRRELFESVRRQPGVEWGMLPKQLLRLGASEDAGERFVHAKIYRFFTQSPKREICFVGSANLTSPAHQAKGNFETGFLVEVPTPRRPDFWMTPEDREPTAFQVRKEDDAAAASSGTRLNLRYHWDWARAEALWDAKDESPELRLEARGISLGSVPALPPKTWIEIDVVLAGRIAESLQETSLFTVYGNDDKPALLLVQEEGMSHKPSLLFRLSATDILRYWSLLTQEQRAAFLEARAPEIALLGEGADLVAQAKITLGEDTLFDRFAGFFHAFGCLEQTVRQSLDAGNEKEANYRLFGKKYDSLGSLLDRLASEDASGDDVDRYVLFLCAKQLCQEVEREYPDYWRAHRDDARSLVARFAYLDTLRKRLIEHNSNEPEWGGFESFLQWFDRWFLRRAKPVAEVGE